MQCNIYTTFFCKSILAPILCVTTRKSHARVGAIPIGDRQAHIFPWSWTTRAPLAITATGKNAVTCRGSHRGLFQQTAQVRNRGRPPHQALLPAIGMQQTRRLRNRQKSTRRLRSRFDRLHPFRLALLRGLPIKVGRASFSP